MASMRWTRTFLPMALGGLAIGLVVWILFERRSPPPLLHPGSARAAAGGPLAAGTADGGAAPGGFPAEASGHAAAGRSPAVRPAAAARPIQPAKRPAPPAAAAGPAPRPSGRVVDASSGESLPRALVRATYSHSDDGYPPLEEEGSRLGVFADGDGLFQLPPFHPEDPGLSLHLEVTHAGCLPRVLILKAGASASAPWPFATVQLRRGWTRPVHFFDPAGRPLAGAALSIAELEDDEPIPEEAWDEDQTVRPRRLSIRYTQEDGALILGPEPVRVALHSPELHLWDERAREPLAALFLDFPSPHRPGAPPDMRLEAPTRAGRAGSACTLLDGRSQPVAGALVEVQLQGMPPVRLYTDSSGGFRFAPRPFPSSQAALGAANPRTGKLVALSPHYWKRETEVALPSRARLFHLSGGRAPELRFRLREKTRQGELRAVAQERTAGGAGRHGVAGPEARPATTPLRGAVPGRESAETEGELRPAPADLVQLSADLTCIHRSAGGEAVFCGGLPRGGTELWIGASGFLPARVQFPAHRPPDLLVDLGEVALERGLALKAALAGFDRLACERARLRASASGFPAFFHEVRFDERGQTVLSGLLEGQTYRYAVEGSWIEKLSGEFLATRRLCEEGLRLDAPDGREVEVWLGGEVTGLRAEESPWFQVIERYYPDHEAEPITCEPYPLPGDRTFGSRRRLRPPRHAEVFILGPDFLGAAAARIRPAGGWEFDMGRLAVEERPHAIFTFKTAELERARPPRDLSLYAGANLYHEAARLSVLGDYVVIENLVPGRWQLRWNRQRFDRESFSFEVKEGEREVREAIPRRGEEEEEVDLFLVDDRGEPVSGARITALKEGGQAEAARAENGREEAAGGGAARVGETGAAARPVQGFRRPRFFDALGRRLPRGALDPGGHYRVAIRPHEETRLRIRAPGFLPAQLILPPRQPVPERVALRRGVKVKAMVFAPDLTLFEGPLEVSWQDPRGEAGSARVIGELATLAIRRGRLESDQLPEGLLRLRFLQASSEAQHQGDFELAGRGVNDLGRIQLKEARRLEGTVFLPGGQPAANATVRLVRLEKIHRFPQQAEDRDGLEFAARADALGKFVIDGLPVRFKDELALVAHLPGWTDAVEAPLDLKAPPHLLHLNFGASLNLDIGYSDGADYPDYRFRLQFADPRHPNEEFKDAGPLAPVPAGGAWHLGITPGRYRVVWDLAETLPGYALYSREAEAAPGAAAALSLRLHERFLPGEASWNGALLDLGWLLLTADPGDPRASRLARVARGSFTAPVPPRAARLFAALIPQRHPQPLPDLRRGVALPVEVGDFELALRRGFLAVDYWASTLTIELAPEMLARYPDLEVEFPHYRWAGGGYRQELASEPIVQSPFTLSLLTITRFPIKIGGRGGYRFFQAVQLDRDLTITLRN